MTSSGGRRRARRGDPHGWNAFDNYIKVHEGYLDRLRGDFVLEDTLQRGFPAPDVFEIRGRVVCRHGLFVEVKKTLEINDRDQVRTVKYSYHAGVEGRQDRAIFRYDNAHPYAQEGHADEHHRHRYDHTTWREIRPPVWVGRDGWPHLDQVIEELREWWETTGRHLDLTEPPPDEGRSDEGA